VRCGYISSNELCKACVLLEGLNRGAPALGVRSDKSRAAREARETRTEQGIGRTIPRWQGVQKGPHLEW